MQIIKVRYYIDNQKEGSKEIDTIIKRRSCEQFTGTFNDRY